MAAVSGLGGIAGSALPLFIGINYGVLWVKL
jgi:hypothetical protein